MKQWNNPLSNFLSEESFKTLQAEYPRLGLFVFTPKVDKRYELHDGAGYSASSRFVLDGTPELLPKLSPAWQDFVHQMTDPDGAYIQKIKTLIQQPFEITYSWHLAHEGFYLKPHKDGYPKIATHLSYFNSAADWKEEWGGHLQVFEGKHPNTDPMWPAFFDFDKATPQPLLDNKGFFLKRTADSWHGVYPITAPRGKYRKLFSVVFEEI